VLLAAARASTRRVRGACAGARVAGSRARVHAPLKRRRGQGRARSLFLSASDAAELALGYLNGSAVPLDSAAVWTRDALNGNGSVMLLEYTQPRGGRRRALTLSLSGLILGWVDTLRSQRRARACAFRCIQCWRDDNTHDSSSYGIAVQRSTPRAPRTTAPCERSQPDQDRSCFQVAHQRSQTISTPASHRPPFVARQNGLVQAHKGLGSARRAPPAPQRSDRHARGGQACTRSTSRSTGRPAWRPTCAWSGRGARRPRARPPSRRPCSGARCAPRAAAPCFVAHSCPA